MQTSTESLFAQAVLRADRRKRRDRWTKVTASLVGNVVFALIGGLWLMLAVGVAHHEWLPNLPTIGYWPSVLLSALLSHAFIRYEHGES